MNVDGPPELTGTLSFYPAAFGPHWRNNAPAGQKSEKKHKKERNETEGRRRKL
jgi:hypothetical protein